MVLAIFKIKDKLKKTQFFQKTFFLTDTSIDIILNIFFLTLSNANVLFAKKELIC